ncbi:pyrroline-5-carboxylate reductase [Holotrichia oblita]|nr:pyrroline-5-carboxylate reductase [Holotrichia oblita]
MAEAFISGIIEDGLIGKENIWVTNRSDSNRLSDISKKYGIRSSYDLNELFDGADIVILAVKPKDAAAAIREARDYLTGQMLIVSVMAGVSINAIELLLEKPVSIARAMPNTSAAVRKSATAVAINDRVMENQIKDVKKLFDTVGFTTFVEENQLDAVTGLSGSGPAYIYYLIEAMENSAIAVGLDGQTAQDLIVQTLIGAAEMVHKSTKTSNELRRNVTSPGGTTEAGIKVLENKGVRDAFIECIKAATTQSEKMGHELLSELIRKKQ